MDAASWARAKDVIAEALKRPPSDRETFVREQCRSASESAEILAMLSAYGPGSQFLDTTAQPSLDAGIEPPDLEPGTRVGPYVIVDCIGRGGMGQVFLGSDPRLRRKVALKCMLSSVPGDSRREQILNEARAAARISHPNVATIHDVIEKDDRAFIVMEYVEGESLAARIKGERLPIDRVIAIGRQLASALIAAHAKGVVHRDLKPANVHLTADGTVKVLDFGIANSAARTLPTAATTSITTAAVAVPLLRRGQPGTPPYMSPEQLLDRTVDERTDIFSLGVILFELAVGHRPFPGSDSAGLVAAQANGAPRANAVDARVPAVLSDVIARALAIDPGARYQSAREVATALDVVAATVQQRATEHGEPLRRRAARVAIGVPLMILAVAAIGFTTSAGFNNTFGRTGGLARFGVEPWPAYFTWGVLAAFPSLFVMTLMAVAALAVRFAVRALELVGPVARVTLPIRAAFRKTALQMSLDRPGTRAQALAALGVVMIASLSWYYRDVIGAWTSLFNSAPIERLRPMGPQNYGRNGYIIALDATMLALGYGLFTVLRLRRAANSREDRTGVALLVSLILVIVLMSEWPYRVLNHRDFERADLSGLRCYITGQTSEEFLLVCPASDPPRNRAVKRNDPGLHRPGITENVFKAVSP